MNKKFNKKSLFYFVLAILLLYILLFDNSSFLQRFRLSLKVNKLRSEINNLISENEQLEKENSALESDPQILEEKARELGMQKENEEVYIFKKEESQ
jgi:cell division protein FtsB